MSLSNTTENAALKMFLQGTDPSYRAGATQYLALFTADPGEAASLAAEATYTGYARVATSLANAIAGTVIAYTDVGTGTHTVTMQMPRYADGVGCEAFFVAQTAPSTGGPNLSASSYTNTAGTAGRAFQGSPTMGAAADAYATRILHSGNAAGRYGPFLPRQGGDTGIKSIESFTWSGGTAYTGSGVVALCIARPLCDLSIPVTGMWSERDLVNQLPSLPQVYDGACLGWLLFSTGATTNNSPFTTAVDFGWGG